MKMASQVTVSGSELLDIDICDRGICSEDESGVFVNSSASLSDAFSEFQHWSASGSVSVSANDLPSDTSSIAGLSHCLAQQVPNRHGTSNGTKATAYSGNAVADLDACQYDYIIARRPSIVDCLLIELYDTYTGRRRNVDSFDSSTEASGSDAFLGRSNSGSSFLQELQEKHTRRHQMNYLAQKAPEELHSIIQEVKYRTGLQSAKLLRQLKRRDRLYRKLQKNCDIITACLQAVSQKRRVDTRLKFSIEPSLGKNGFQQWYDALKAVARLPTGIPKEWRKRVWLTLADRYLHSISIDWEKTLRFAFNERSNPDDDSLGIQIVKDLHRTGCSSYCGQEGEQDRVVLKRVLLAYARWNKSVGYCQGFNVLAALILEVTDGNESDALKVMIYLIDKVLPESYFANNLQALSVDMAVFRDLLRVKLPRLSHHLHHLQKNANREAGGSYEPPLTNVFTMQWFLTMFATCLPPQTVLKIWDSVFFEGSEVLLRVALAIWERLGERIEYCQTADEFYSTMGCLTQEMLEHSLIHPTELMQEVYSMAVFPFPQLAELREKYTYNITPFPTSVKSNGSGGLGNWESDDDGDMDDEDSVVTALGCLGPLGGLLAPELQRYQKHLREQRGEQGNIGELSPGAVGGSGLGSGGGGGGAPGGRKPEPQAAVNGMMMERMSTDIGALKRQYVRIKRRQQQQAMQLCIRTDKCPATSVLASQLNTSAPVVNHLLLGRKPRTSPRTAKPTFTSGPTCPASSLAGGSSPWRAHVRAHRRSLARTRTQPARGDSEELEEERGIERRGAGGADGTDGGDGQRVTGDEVDDGGSSVSVAPSEEVSEEAMSEGGAREVEVRLASLDLGARPNSPTDDPSRLPATASPPESDPEIPVLHPPPAQAARRRKESESSGSEGRASTLGRSASLALPLPHFSSSPQSSSTPAPRPSASPILLDAPLSPAHSFTMTASPSLPSFGKPRPPSTPDLASSLASASSVCSTPTLSKLPLFSPFPCVKQPRKSAAARNLGLYGPTARTPNVHFPQLSRGSGGASATPAATSRRR